MSDSQEDVTLPELPPCDVGIPGQIMFAYSPDALREYARQAVLMERGRCAAICDAVYAEEQLEPVCYGFASECAEKIRGSSK